MANKETATYEFNFPRPAEPAITYAAQVDELGTLVAASVDALCNHKRDTAPAKMAYRVVLVIRQAESILYGVNEVYNVDLDAIATEVMKVECNDSPDMLSFISRKRGEVD